MVHKLNLPIPDASRRSLSALFGRHAESLLAMTRAGLESVYWRQDRYPTGGIVESDERVDGGRKLYWPWCWPRSFIVEPLLAAGQFERVRRFLLFWEACQRPDGDWRHCYDVRDGAEYGSSWPETDNAGYMLWHIRNYVEAAGEAEFAQQHWRMIERAADFLSSRFSPEFDLIWGMEEVLLPGWDPSTPIRYSLHINTICSLGLRSAAEIAGRLGRHRRKTRWLALAERVERLGMEKHLWDAQENVFAYGLTETGQRLTTAVLWMTLMPHFVSRRWNGMIEQTLAYVDRRLYDKDARIPKTYWTCDLTPLLDAGAPQTRFSGHGIGVGGLALVVDACLRAGRIARAAEQIDTLIRLTHPENRLVPEHVNTVDRGRLGGYSIYPEPQYQVDSGNLLHLSFFLTLVARHDPQMFRTAARHAAGTRE